MLYLLSPPDQDLLLILVLCPALWSCQSVLGRPQYSDYLLFDILTKLIISEY